MKRTFDQIDRQVTNWMARYGIDLLRINLGVVFLWFGVLKFYPDWSPAEALASKTLKVFTLGAVTDRTAVFVLGLWECLIGLGLISRVFMRATLFLLFVQMIGTFSPIFLFPSEVFTRFPLVPSLEGQYIIKNLVLVSAGLVLGATVRGGRVISEPKSSDRSR